MLKTAKLNMIYLKIIEPILQILLVILPILIAVAYVTVAERKTMASMQRRLGPNIVGYYGLLQAFADALKLILKEYISPSQSNLALFFIGPILTLIFSLLGFLVVPFGPGNTLFDFDLGILYLLAVSSISTYGILLAGWSANSKYAFLGSLRSTAQLISYELILSSAVLIIIIITGSLNLTTNIESQMPIWFIFPLLPVFLIFIISSIAETNRAPFDLAEAESELVSGFMTEHAAIIFVYFFLAEYASILLICILNSILFIGGYTGGINIIYDIDNFITFLTKYIYFEHYYWLLYHNSSVLDGIFILDNSFNGYYYGISLGIKSSILIFIFIWVRASFPRIRFDQLMLYCWTVLLPLVIALIIVIPCILYAFEIISINIF